MNELKAALERIIAWTKLKCRLQASGSAVVYFRERQIWWAHLGENLGQEQSGKNSIFDRPVLIVKKFNNNLLLILPLSTTEKVGKYYLPTSHGMEQRSAVIILSQLRTISSKRLIRKQRTLPEDEFALVRQRLKEML